MAHFLPVIRADLCRFETFRCKSSECVLRCSVTVMAGIGDPHVAVDEMAVWCHFANGSFRFEQFPGGHFFNYVPTTVTPLVRNRLLTKSKES